MDSRRIKLDADKWERSVDLRLFWKGELRGENHFRMPPSRSV